MMRINGSKLVVALVCLVSVLSVAGYTVVQKGPSKNDARQLIRRFAGIELPSDAVTVKDISALGSTAVVVAQIETAFRLARGGDGKWQVVEVRAGDNRWEDVGLLKRALDAEKSARAQAEIETLATALEAYRRELGFYVTAKDAAVLTDHINPRYSLRVIRVDPWHRPYRYEGSFSSYIISSDGADGQPNTADDIFKRSTSS